MSGSFFGGSEDFDPLDPDDTGLVSSDVGLAGLASSEEGLADLLGSDEGLTGLVITDEGLVSVFLALKLELENPNRLFDVLSVKVSDFFRSGLDEPKRWAGTLAGMLRSGLEEPRRIDEETGWSFFRSELDETIRFPGIWEALSLFLRSGLEESSRVAGFLAGTFKAEVEDPSFLTEPMGFDIPCWNNQEIECNWVLNVEIMVEYY